MTARKTLQIRAPSECTDTAPALKKKGRGWEISEKRLDVLHEQARELRRHSSEAHKALAKRFAEADLGRYKFTRHMVIGSEITADRLSFAMQPGLGQEEVALSCKGFAKDLRKELPMGFTVETQKLLAISLEGSVE